MAKKRTTHERLYLLQWTLSELRRFRQQEGKGYSLACFKYMRQIIKILNEEMYMNELRITERMKRAGELTPKEAVSRNAKQRKKYLL